MFEICQKLLQMIRVSLNIIPKCLAKNRFLFNSATARVTSELNTFSNFSKGSVIVCSAELVLVSNQNLQGDKNFHAV